MADRRPGSQRHPRARCRSWGPGGSNRRRRRRSWGPGGSGRRRRSSPLAGSGLQRRRQRQRRSWPRREPWHGVRHACWERTRFAGPQRARDQWPRPSPRRPSTPWTTEPQSRPSQRHAAIVGNRRCETQSSDPSRLVMQTAVQLDSPEPHPDAHAHLGVAAVTEPAQTCEWVRACEWGKAEDAWPLGHVVRWIHSPCVSRPRCEYGRGSWSHRPS